MNVGKTLFAQVTEYVPWKTFGRIIERHSGGAGVRTSLRFPFSARHRGRRDHAHLRRALRGKIPIHYI